MNYTRAETRPERGRSGRTLAEEQSCRNILATASTHLSTATRSSSARRAPREGGDHWVELERPALKQLIVFAIRVGMLQEAPIDPGFTHAFSERRILCAMEEKF